MRARVLVPIVVASFSALLAGALEWVLDNRLLAWDGDCDLESCRWDLVMLALVPALVSFVVFLVSGRFLLKIARERLQGTRLDSPVRRVLYPFLLVGIPATLAPMMLAVMSNMPTEPLDGASLNDLVFLGPIFLYGGLSPPFTAVALLLANALIRGKREQRPPRPDSSPPGGP